MENITENLTSCKSGEHTFLRALLDQKEENSSEQNHKVLAWQRQISHCWVGQPCLILISTPTPLLCCHGDYFLAVFCIIIPHTKAPLRGDTADSPFTNGTTWQGDIYDLRLPVRSLLSIPENIPAPILKLKEDLGFNFKAYSWGEKRVSTIFSSSYHRVTSGPTSNIYTEISGHWGSTP